jgi:hypothetical protein
LATPQWIQRVSAMHNVRVLFDGNRRRVHS